MGELELYGLGHGYIDDYGQELRQVRPEDTHQVIADAFPQADDLQIVLIGDAAKIRDQARNYGTVTEMPLTRPDFTPGQR